jgi:hypothetical protein
MAGNPSEEVAPGMFGKLTNTLAFLNPVRVVEIETQLWSSTFAKPPSIQ